MTNHNDDSSSEDENIKEALKEATDHDFLQNSLFNNDKSWAKLNDISLTGGNIKPSARFHLRRNGSFESFGVSHNYKEFVAQRLFKLLKRNIELLELVDTKRIKKKRRTKGIRLLISSPNILVCHDEAAQACAMPVKKKTVDENFAMNMKKCMEVAVDPGLIIAKTETVQWDERQKGTVFKYKKMSDGTFIEQT